MVLKTFICLLNVYKHLQCLLDSTTTAQERSGPIRTSSSSATGVGQYDQSFASAFAYPLESDDVPFSEEHYSEAALYGTLSESEDDQLSDTVEKPEQMEEMNYRETVLYILS